MLRYIVKRVIAGFLSLFMLITLTFFLMHVIPGGPFSPGEYRKTPPEVLKQIQDSYGLNDPIHVQYGRYLNNLAHGNLGVSFKKLNYSVNELISNGAPVSAKVGFWAILLALLVGIPLGTTAAVRRGIARVRVRANGSTAPCRARARRIGACAAYARIAAVLRRTLRHDPLRTSGAVGAPAALIGAVMLWCGGCVLASACARFNRAGISCLRIACRRVRIADMLAPGRTALIRSSALPRLHTGLRLS